MKITAPRLLNWLAAGIFMTAGMLSVGGCAGNRSAPQTPATQPAARTPGQPAPGQPVFNTDADAADALLAAAKAGDRDQVHHLLGPAWRELSSGDPTEDAADFKDFAARAGEKMRIEKSDDSTALLHVGKDDWTLPIPIVKDPAGKWFLDTEAGKSEVLARRIGQNELDAIAICRLYVRAQHEYASEDHDGSGEVKYAQRILSAPGKRDGLYWNVAPGAEHSPLARLIADEKLDGYDPAPGKHSPYHGYHFRVLKRQGENAAGGKMDYIVNGNMTRGFALIAYPTEYEASGVMTFMVNQEGQVYQKDLGPDTTNIARHVTEYDPDASWTVVKN